MRGKFVGMLSHIKHDKKLPSEQKEKIMRKYENTKNFFAGTLSEPGKNIRVYWQ